MFEHARQAALAALVTGTVFAGAYAQDDAAATKIDPKADDIVKKMVAHYHDAQSVSCNIDLSMSMSMGDANQKMDTGLAFAAERPNLFAMRLTEGMMGVTIVADGEHLYTYVPMMGNYTKVTSPENFDALMEEAAMATNMTGAGEGQLLLGLLSEDGYKQVMTGVSALEYVGEEKLDDLATNHLKLYRDEIDMDIWVTTGDKPWLVKMVPDVQKAMQKAAAEQEDSPYANMQVSMYVNFSDWSIDKPAEGTFVFEAPSSAKEVESLFEMPEFDETEGPESALINNPAPDFTLEILGKDDKFTLSSLKDKNIVVLDFWATWCRPCVQALPTLDEVTKSFADRGVVFYAVDLQEPDDKVKAFLSEKGWNFNVLMDRMGEVANQYKVNGIPQTVIIGKDGKVAAVHVGLLPNLREKLTEELEMLIAGGQISSHD